MAPVAVQLPRITEKQFMAQIVQLAKLQRWMVFHTFLSIRSEPGFPDLVLVKGSRCVFAEVKSASGKLSAAQASWVAALSACPGVECYVWRPSGWESEIVPVLSRTR